MRFQFGVVKVTPRHPLIGFQFGRVFVSEVKGY